MKIKAWHARQSTKPGVRRMMHEHNQKLRTSVQSSHPIQHLTMAPTKSTLTPIRAIRAILQYPTSLRPLLSPPRTPILAPPSLRTYHSYETAPKPPYPATESAILAAGLAQVPAHGFSKTALRQGALDAGFLEASTNLFSRGEFELVMWHLQTQRLGLKDRIEGLDQGAGLAKRVRGLVLERLGGNIRAGVGGRRMQEVRMSGARSVVLCAFRWRGRDVCRRETSSLRFSYRASVSCPLPAIFPRRYASCSC